MNPREADFYKVISFLRQLKSKTPIWGLVELLTLGSLSRLFKNLTPEVRDEICKSNYGKINELEIVRYQKRKLKTSEGVEDVVYFAADL